MLLQIHESVNQVNVALPVLLERETRFELATPTLARLCSTTELFPLDRCSQTMSSSFPACAAKWRPIGGEPLFPP